MLKIVSAEIVHPEMMGSSKIVVTLEDGSMATALEYFADELTFTESEVIGLSVDEVRDLWSKKDIAYLRS